MYDVSSTHPSVIVAEAFRCSHLVFASTTYNAGVFCNMETVINDLTAHNIQNRTIALIENGTWAATSGGLMRQQLEKCRNMNILENMVSLKSSLKTHQLEEMDALADSIYESMPKEKQITHNDTMVEQDAMFRIEYGLFVLTAKSKGRDNGCIINTVTQVTDSPKRISISVNKANLTHDMILESGLFNVSVLTTDTPFKAFEHFGFQSGREADKFDAAGRIDRAENGLAYIERYTNAFISARVVHAYDYATHTLFVADVTEARVLSNTPSLTYGYYLDHIKPKPQSLGQDKKGYVCKICGYVYEGGELPKDFICPLCKHGAEDFERLG
jgi:flavin reductase (DIM6/NTAB) family NADH-FMN oxidoreductase RutF